MMLTLEAACGFKVAETEGDRAAGKWEPGQGRVRPRDPAQRVRFCAQDAGHRGDHSARGRWAE